MKIIDGKLYLEIAEAVEAGIGSEEYLWKAKSNGTKCYTFIKDPSDRRCALLHYDSLKLAHKTKVNARFGNPYDLVARQPILDMVQSDPAAFDYYFSFTYDLNGKPSRLSLQQVAQSTRSAAWLSLIQKVNGKGWRDIKDAIGLKHIPEFFGHTEELIHLEIANGKSETFGHGERQLPGTFPASYQRLKLKAAEFAEQGFDHCLPRGLGNKVAAKLGKTETGFDPQREADQIAVIRQLASRHNNFDAGQVAKFATQVFKANGWEMVSDQRIYQILQEYKAVLTPGRRGKKAYNNSVAAQVKRKAPEYPTAYFTVDGWTPELLYKVGAEYHHRLDLVIVLDAHNRYPVGYAIGPQENAELIRMANRSAIVHLNDLFGDFYRPAQIQTDNYAKKALSPFYAAIAGLHTPAAVGNAKSKIIEPYFKDLNKTYCQTQPNWSGFGLTARAENQVNREMVHLIRHAIPDEAGVISQIEAIIATERAKKIDAYRASFAAMPDNLKLRMDYLGLEWLQVFGRPIGRTNSLTGQGIIKQVNGKQYTYECLDPIFRTNIQIDWQLWADPCDPARVLAVSPDEKLRFVLHEKRVLPMDVRSHTQEDWAYLTQLRKFNKDRTEEITQLYAEDADTLRRVLNDTPRLDKENESVLKLMPVYGGQQKEVLQVAKGLRKKQDRQQAQAIQQADNSFAAQRAEFLNAGIDFNQYLNND